MTTALPTAPAAYGLKGSSATVTVDNATPQGATYRCENSVQTNWTTARIGHTPTPVCSRQQVPLSGLPYDMPNRCSDCTRKRLGRIRVEEFFPCAYLSFARLTAAAILLYGCNNNQAAQEFPVFDKVIVNRNGPTDPWGKATGDISGDENLT